MGANRAMNQSEFFEITRNFLKAWEKIAGDKVFGFDFVSRWLRNWREIFTPVSKRINRNYLITFDSLL